VLGVEPSSSGSVSHGIGLTVLFLLEGWELGHGWICSVRYATRGSWFYME
jgi:hypothetical protein